ncbi:hypothetical protein PIB30_098655, partial [Stylosanthes scabra]|nr:hypothetical protein [Stylosanthes scabra]
MGMITHSPWYYMGSDTLVGVLQIKRFVASTAVLTRVAERLLQRQQRCMRFGGILRNLHRFASTTTT